MTKTKPMTDEWKQIEVISKSSPELLKIVGKHSTLWNYSKLETIEKINDLLTQATSKAREEERTKFIHLLKTTPYGFPNADMSPSTFIENVIKSLKKDK